MARHKEKPFPMAARSGTVSPMKPAPAIALLICAACTQEANHIPNPLALPGQAVTAGWHNAAYNARRARVSDHVTAQHPAILSEIAREGPTPQLTKAMDLARVPKPRRAALRAGLKSDIALYRADKEALTVALMVHGP